MAMEKEESTRTDFVLVKHESMPSPGLSEDETENETPLLGEAFARGSSFFKGGGEDKEANGALLPLSQLRTRLAEQAREEHPQEGGQEDAARREEDEKSEKLGDDTTQNLGGGAEEDSASEAVVVAQPSAETVQENGTEVSFMPRGNVEVAEKEVESLMHQETRREKQYGVVASLFWWWGVPEDDDEEDGVWEGKGAQDATISRTGPVERQKFGRFGGPRGSFIV
uniref:Uncharacterized protein n=2 Tax=Pinguiococcus pyrenoidosus TaxID=172671 RepID=A0A7R9UIC0_9STRA|mmetsp:Transcript_957/g.4038  ORF Transcript_957/g.4038 Transcript_957/m.4038 type:complete len:225 (+) Transcript_957:210-884(+)|eukprot:scaffold1850_cov194-Pinguiococcus_pyrenoidosus.AAC.10